MPLGSAERRRKGSPELPPPPPPCASGFSSALRSGATRRAIGRSNRLADFCKGYMRGCQAKGLNLHGLALIQR